MRRVKRILLGIGIIGAFGLLFVYPQQIRQGICDGLMLCGEIVIPSLLPFMAIANFISRTKGADILATPFKSVIHHIYKLPNAVCGTILISLVGGYPAGATAVANLYSGGLISRKDASKMLTFCANAGPAMTVIAIGKNMLGNIYVGWAIYLSHIAAALLTGVCFAMFDKGDKDNPSPKTQRQGVADAFVSGVSDASLQMLTVCGFVVIFSGITAIFKLWNTPWLCTLAEVTCGTSWAASSGLSAPIICAIVSFGGFSVICQIFALSKGVIPFGKLILSRVLNGSLAFAICSIFIKVLPDSLQVISNLQGEALVVKDFKILLSLSMLFMTAVFLCSLGNKEKVLQKYA